jgi:hypothetical protein
MVKVTIAIFSAKDAKALVVHVRQDGRQRHAAFI